MLDEAIKNQLQDYFKKIHNPVFMEYEPGEHAHKAELLQMLNAVAELNEKIIVRERKGGDALRGPLSFTLATEERHTGVVFSGIPGGHEFSSLVLAILQTGGAEIKLDESIQNFVRRIGTRLRFETVVSLSCHNCPDVVQTMNSMAFLNPDITHEMIDGSHSQDLIRERGIQGVPSVWLNGLPFADGKIDAGQIVNKLLEMYPDLVSDATAAGDARDSDDDNLYDMAVIGGGPAGVSAAIYAARKGLRVTLVADRLGGQVKDTMAIENLIAVHKTTGPELSADLAENLRAYGVDVKEHLRVTQIGSELADDGCRTIVLNTGDRLRTRVVILATGAQWRQLNVPGEKEYLGKGVAYCPHCDGPFFKGKDVAVIGGGNSGVEAALDLSGIVRSVKLIEFAPRFNADSILLDRVAKTANIESIANAQTIAINGDGQKMTGLRYVDRESGAEHELELDGVFVQIGLIPNTEFVRNLVEVNRFGEIVVDDRCQTNREGIFACGDATVTPYKQIVVALGEGAKAALSAFDYLMKLPTDSPALRAS